MSRHLAVLVVLFLAGPLAAQVGPPGRVDPTGHDAAALRFAEEVFSALADSFGVPGAVLAVVGPEGLLALEGYGYADRSARQPADPERTLFRVASVSKPVTATAVLALWERGLLPLDADVNDALARVRVPDAFDTPVTAHDLLTHTAGFDEQLFASGDPDRAPDLATYLSATLPARVYPPGQIHSYSNHGYGLLGVLVEDATGRPFDEAVDRLVFAPLGMNSSTFRQPPPLALLNRLATGYACAGDACTPLPYDFVAFGPAGALQTTAADMARFVASHLGGARGVVSDSTRQIMHAPQWQPHPALGGMGYGFYRGLVGRYDVLRHAGGWAGWSSQIVLVPEVGLGYFVAVNTDAHPFMGALLERFADEVLGGPMPPPDARLLPVDLDRYTGTYRLARHAHRGADKVALLVGLPMPDLRVEAEGDTALVAVVGASRERMYPLAPDAFIRPGLDPRRYAFELEGGRAVRIHTDYASLERIPWWATRRTSLVVLAVCFVVFTSAVGAWLVVCLRRRWRGVPEDEVPRVLEWARGFAAAAAASHLAFAVGLAGAVVVLGPQGIVHPLPLWMRTLFVLPIVGGLLGVLTVPAAVRVWRRGLGSLGSRVHYALVALAALFVLPVLLFWNLLGLQF